MKKIYDQALIHQLFIAPRTGQGDNYLKMWNISEEVMQELDIITACTYWHLYSVPHT